MAIIASRMSVREREGSLKGKYGLALGLFANNFLQCFRWRKIDTDSQQLREAVFDANHVHKGKAASRLELGNDVYIG